MALSTTTTPRTTRTTKSTTTFLACLMLLLSLHNVPQAVADTFSDVQAVIDKIPNDDSCKFSFGALALPNGIVTTCYRLEYVEEPLHNMCKKLEAAKVTEYFVEIKNIICNAEGGVTSANTNGGGKSNGGTAKDGGGKTNGGTAKDGGGIKTNGDTDYWSTKVNSYVKKIANGSGCKTTLNGFLASCHRVPDTCCKDFAAIGRKETFEQICQNTEYRSSEFEKTLCDGSPTLFTSSLTIIISAFVIIRCV